jgi:predicted nucleotidyltransferase
MGKLQIEVPKLEVEEFCKRWKIIELSFFGSVLRDDFKKESDIDILVKFSPHASWGLFDLVRMEEELSQIFRRRVDLVSKKAIENSRNWIRKQNILESAEVYYAA